MIGNTCGHYHLIEKIGGGRIGIVYKAESSMNPSDFRPLLDAQQNFWANISVTVTEIQAEIYIGQQGLLSPQNRSSSVGLRDAYILKGLNAIEQYSKCTADERIACYARIPPFT
jgi:hypothetical protein